MLNPKPVPSHILHLINKDNLKMSGEELKMQKIQNNISNKNLQLIKFQKEKARV